MSLFNRSIGFGTAAWFGAAQFVKYTAIGEWSNGGLYGTSFVVGVSVLLPTKMLGVPPKDAFTFITLATAIALMLDGFATVNYPSLYTFGNSTTPLNSLAAIAFGAGCGLFASYFVSKNGSYGF
jgi:hypothetical protein